MKTGKDPEFPKEIFADVDLNGPPIVINAVETGLLSPTEGAYYFASTSIRNVFTKKEETKKPKEINDDTKDKCIQKKEVKKRKRKTAEHPEKSGDLSDEGGEGQNEPKTDEDNTCMACGSLYKVADTMIGCDGNCVGWYHMECAHLTKEDIEKYEGTEWTCEYCLKGVDPPYAKKNLSNEPVRKKKKTGIK